jgi:hypothetical protein
MLTFRKTLHIPYLLLGEIGMLDWSSSSGSFKVSVSPL